MPKINETISLIRSFTDLPNGWRFGKGGPLNPITIEIGVMLVEVARDSDLERFNAFAGEDGDLLVSFYYENRTLDITIEVDGTFTVFEDDDDASEEIEYCEGLTFTNALDKLWRFIQSITELSIQETMTKKVGASKAVALSRLRSTKESQSYTANAVLTAAAGSAPTSKSSMLTSQEYRRSYFTSQPKISPAIAP